MPAWLGSGEDPHLDGRLLTSPCSVQRLSTLCGALFHKDPRSPTSGLWICIYLPTSPPLYSSASVSPADLTSHIFPSLPPSCAAVCATGKEEGVPRPSVLPGHASPGQWDQWSERPRINRSPLWRACLCPPKPYTTFCPSGQIREPHWGPHGI